MSINFCLPQVFKKACIVCLLCLFAIKAHANIVKLLLEAGADPHLIDDWGKKAIEYAWESGYTKSIELLGAYEERGILQ